MAHIAADIHRGGRLCRVLIYGNPLTVTIGVIWVSYLFLSEDDADSADRLPTLTSKVGPEKSDA